MQSGPSPGYSSRGGQKPKRGAKNQKGGHIFKTQYWIYAATGGQNVKLGGTDFKWEEQAPLAPPLATALDAVKRHSSHPVYHHPITCCQTP